MTSTIASRLSERVNRVKPSAIRRMLQAASGVRDAIHLEQGEPDFATPSHIIEAALDAARGGATHYTPIDGALELRSAIARKLERENHITADPETEVTVTSGSQECMLAASLAFLDPGDEALVLSPYYPAHYEDVLLAEASPVEVPLDQGEGGEVTYEILEGKATSRTKLLWVCSPSNPTGRVFSRKEIETIAEFAIDRDLLVLSDEIYERLTYDGAEHISIASLPEMHDHTITINGFSKTYAMTGWRIGYMVAPKALSDGLRKVHYYMALCPNSISQKAALAALEGPQDCVRQMVEEYARRRRLVSSMLSEMAGVDFATPSGAFYFFPDFSSFIKDDLSLAMDLLRKAKVVTVPGSGFGSAGVGHLRISYSTKPEVIEEGLKRISDYLYSLR